MTHLLDNPIWNALNTGNKELASGTDRAQFLKRDVGLFAGLKTNSESELEELQSLIPQKGMVVLFIPEAIEVPAGWRVQLQKDIFQMVYEGKALEGAEANNPVALQEKDIPAMLELTRLTNPGPFLSRTIEFGSYEGFFEGDNLVAMTGQRLQPHPYIEVSAVCTHPDHVGKGYAAALVRSQMCKITAASCIPFLHVYPDNTAACNLYKKLGFRTRKGMQVYVLQKE